MKQGELERLDKAIYPAPARKRNFKRIACYALFGAAMAVVPPRAWADPNTPIGGAPRFFKLDNSGDLNFNQLLGINNNEIIAGYFGDGTAIVNNGYVLVPNTHYSVENFAGTPPAGHTITQTQAIGINNNEVPSSSGFGRIKTAFSLALTMSRACSKLSLIQMLPPQVSTRTFSASMTRMRLPDSGPIAAATNMVSLLTLLPRPGIY